MCGIAGTMSLKGELLLPESRIPETLQSLRHRGPDGSGHWKNDTIALFHSRLSIIDVDPRSSQPMWNKDGTAVIVFNGEIFNYRELQQQYNIQCSTQSDTEILLHLLDRFPANQVLQQLTGFFAFAYYRVKDNELLLARDRYGEKPLYVHEDLNTISFASEPDALIRMGMTATLNHEVFYHFLHFNYVPANLSMFKGVTQLAPGQLLFFKNGSITRSDWYTIPKASAAITNLEVAKVELRALMEKAVRSRMVADVTIGGFLSGGIDSSIVCALAVQENKSFRTFSIGFTDASYFDESVYAEEVAQHIGAAHTTYKISSHDVLNTIEPLLQHQSEPFADSSALAVNVLCKSAQREVKVALTGDGADELFGGYNKHTAEFRLRNNAIWNAAVSASTPLFGMIPASRTSVTGNIVRKLRKYKEGLQLHPNERYYRWAGYTVKSDLVSLLRSDFVLNETVVEAIRQGISGNVEGFNDVLYNDIIIVLPGDMLVKGDRMSMLNGLEIRSPFLDHNVVEYALQCHEQLKNNGKKGKLLLREAFKNDLPSSVFERPKKGFEVPLQQWLQTDLRHLTERYLNQDFLENQGIFEITEVKALLTQLHSNNPGDAAARVWGLLTFNCWYAKYLM
jgi:asparagine synthase (glutamine-hydrolysing)